MRSSSRSRPSSVFKRLQEIVAADLERVLARPEPLHDFERRILAVGLHRQQPPARLEAARQRRQHLLGLELRRHARAPGLRGEDEIVISGGRPGLGMTASSMNS